MKIKELLEIRNEIERFDKALNDSIKLARETTGYFSHGLQEHLRVNDIHGTHQLGHLKREYLSLKFNLNKLL